MTSHYEAIAWERRANGARMFVATRRHYRVPGAARTLCGVAIPAKILNPPARWSGPQSLDTMTPPEIAAEPACTRCAARAGVVS